MKYLRRYLHAFLFWSEHLIQKKFILLLAILSWCKHLLHYHVLSLSDLVLDIIADSIFGYLYQAVFILDCFHVMLFNSMQWLNVLKQSILIIFRWFYLGKVNGEGAWCRAFSRYGLRWSVSATSTNKWQVEEVTIILIFAFTRILGHLIKILHGV